MQLTISGPRCALFERLFTNTALGVLFKGSPFRCHSHLGAFFSVLGRLNPSPIVKHVPFYMSILYWPFTIIMFSFNVLFAQTLSSFSYFKSFEHYIHVMLLYKTNSSVESYILINMVLYLVWPFQFNETIIEFCLDTGIMTVFKRLYM